MKSHITPQMAMVTLYAILYAMLHAILHATTYTCIYIHMPACQQPAALCSQQGRACTAMQLLAAMQLRGPGPDQGSKQLCNYLLLDLAPIGPYWPLLALPDGRLAQARCTPQLAHRTIGYNCIGRLALCHFWLESIRRYQEGAMQ